VDRRGAHRIREREKNYPYSVFECFKTSLSQEKNDATTMSY